jgi:hypothetical protein
VLVLGAIDRRVKCIVSQVPLISGHRNEPDKGGKAGRATLTTLALE